MSIVESLKLELCKISKYVHTMYNRKRRKWLFFILNRGRNAGKPLQEPCPNCFILYCSNLEEMENVYWTFYALWKHGFFHPYLCGSVIEMLRISELKTLMRNFIIPALEKSSQNP